MIAAIILAAGESKRMGTPKALLKIGGKTFVRVIIENHRLAGIDNVIVVLGAHAQEIRNELESLNVTIAYNKDFHHGQLSSVHTGMATVKELSPEAIILHPVDHPLIAPETIRLMLEQFAAGSLPVVLPTHLGKRGHPVIFSSKLFPELLSAPHDTGARFVVHNHGAEILEVAVDDPGILMNIDTPEAYENL